MRERGMGSSGGIEMVTWDVSDVVDGDLVVCCDECVGGVGGADNSDGVGFDDGAGDVVCDGGCIGTEKCGSYGSVVGLVEGSNVRYV